MNNELFKWFGSIGLKTDEVESGLGGVVSKAEEAGDKLIGTFKKAAVAIGTVFAVDKIIDFGKVAVDAAATSQALKSQFEQVFGDMEEEARAGMNKVAQEVGSLPERLLPAFNQISSFAKVNGMETAEALSFTERAMLAAADSAAWYDQSIEQTTDTLQSYLKGNYEVADNLGILSTETTRNAAAAELFGAKYKDLSGLQQQEVLLKMYEEANVLSGALGQAAREADGFENVMGNLKAAWDKFLVVVGSPLLEAVIPILKDITDGVVWLAEATVPVTEKMGKAFEKISAIVTSFYDIIWGSQSSKDNIDLMEQLGISPGFARGLASASEGVRAFNSVVTSIFDIIWGSQSVKDNVDLMEMLGVSPEIASNVAKYADAIRGALLTVQTAVESFWDMLFGSQSDKDNNDLMKQLGINEDVIKVVNLLVNAFRKLQSGIGSFASTAIGLVGGQLKKVKTWFDEFVSVFTEIDFVTLVENLLLFAEEALSVFGELATGIIEFLEPIGEYWENTFDTIQTLFKGLVRAFNQAMRGDWSGAFSTLKTAIGEALISMGDNILEAWSGIWDNVKELVSSINWTDVAQTVMTFLGNAIKGAVDFIGDIGATIFGWAKDKLEVIEWDEVGRSILNGIFIAVSKLAEVGTNIALSIFDFIAGAFTGSGWRSDKMDWGAVAQSILNGILTAIEFLTDMLGTVALAIVSGIAKGIANDDGPFSEIATNIVEAIEDFVNGESMTIDWKTILGIPDWLWWWASGGAFNPGNWSTEQDPSYNPNGEGSGDSTTASGMSNVLNPNGSGFQIELNPDSSKAATVVSTYDTMATESTTGMNKVNQAIRQGYEAIRTTFDQMESNMVKLMTQIMTKITEPVGPGMREVNQEFRQGYEPIRTTFTQMGNNLERLMKEAIQKVVTAVNSNMKNVTTAFKSGVDGVTEAGRETGRGFYNGLNSQKSRIVTLASDIANSVDNTIRRALDINSPSGVGEETMSFYGDGLVNGLLGAVARVKDATEEVADATLFTPRMGGFGSSFGGSSPLEEQQTLLTHLLMVSEETANGINKLVNKDDGLYMDGYELARRGTSYINQENSIRAARATRLSGLTT